MMKAVAMERRGAWSRALVAVAREVGKESDVYKILGSLAWGRFEGEASAADSKDNAVFGYGYLKGYRDAVLSAARVLKLEGEQRLRDCSP